MWVFARVNCTREESKYWIFAWSSIPLWYIPTCSHIAYMNKYIWWKKARKRGKSRAVCRIDEAINTRRWREISMTVRDAMRKIIIEFFWHFWAIKSNLQPSTFLLLFFRRCVVAFRKINVRLPVNGHQQQFHHTHLGEHKWWQHNTFSWRLLIWSNLLLIIVYVNK